MCVCEKNMGHDDCISHPPPHTRGLKSEWSVEHPRTHEQNETISRLAVSQRTHPPNLQYVLLYVYIYIYMYIYICMYRLCLSAFLRTTCI